MMSIPKRLVVTVCRKPLWLVLGILAVSLVFQRQYTQRSAEARAAAYTHHIEQTVRVSEALRSQQIENGTLWSGALHEAMSDNTAADVMTSTTLAGQRRISVVSMPLDSDARYNVSIDIHECHPGSDACSSGGTIRLMTAAGEPVFVCELGVLLPGSTNQSYYSLLWDPARPLPTAEEKLQLLKLLAAGDGQPNAATFFENMQSAYCYTDHQDGPGNRQALQLWHNVLRAIVADRR